MNQKKTIIKLQIVYTAPRKQDTRTRTNVVNERRKLKKKSHHNTTDSQLHQVNCVYKCEINE